MSNRSLEYQARFRADASELKTAEGDLRKVGQEMRGLGMAAGGFVTMSSGLRDALRGNSQGLVTMAMGAGMAWRALSNIHPVLKLISVAMAGAAVVQAIWKRNQEESAKKTDELARKLDETRRAMRELGLEMSRTDQISDVYKRKADDLDRMRRAAEGAITAIRNLADAERALVQASADASLAAINAGEAVALGDTSLSTAKRRAIARDAERERITIRENAALDDIAIQRGLKHREMKDLEGSLERDYTLEQRNLSGEVKEREAALRDSLEKSLLDSAGVAVGQAKTPRGRADALRKHDEEKKRIGRLEIDQMLAEAVNLPDDKRTEIAGAKSALDRARERERAFDLDAAIKGDARWNRRQVLARELKGLDIREGQIIGESTTARTAITAEEEASLAESRRNARRSIAKYRYDQLGDEDKLGVVEGAMERTQRRMASAGISPEDRDAAAVRLVEQARERDAIQSRMAAEQEKLQREQAREAESREKKQEEVSRHEKEIEKLQSARSVQDVGLMEMFRHMYDVEAGRNPDQITADNTEKMAEHLAAISGILKELGR